MPKQKYNYPKLKAEFLKSDFDEVKSFITHKGLKYNAERGRRTKGWAKEKLAIKEKAVEDAAKNVLAKQTKELEIPMEELSIAKKNAVTKVINMMMDDKKPLDVADIERVVKIIRTEMGLPNTYSKNENLNMEKFEGIHIIWKGPEEE